MYQDNDPCPERDHDGHCNCKRETHERIAVPREASYPYKGTQSGT
jgi:hypothetical protein